ALAGCENLSKPDDADDSGGSGVSETARAETVHSSEKQPVKEPFDLYGVVAEDALSSTSVYFYNVSGGYAVYSKNENWKTPPASTLKIMTCLVVLETVSDLDAVVEVPYECFSEFYAGDPNKEDIASAGIFPGAENLTYRDCLYALMVASGCEAANILAYNAAGGDMTAFFGKMNALAAELGCADTNFTNAHGLYEADNYSCAKDMFLITRRAYENHPLFAEICRAGSYEMPPSGGNPGGYTLTARDMLALKREDNPYHTAGANRIKTGSINYFYEYKDGAWDVMSEGTTSLVSCAVYDGEFYILATLGAPYYFGPYTDDDGNVLRGLHYTYLDHKLLYEAAFGNG
ncbi:MAG: serine hydrolase, partial [Oscillospiraceae bacterium]|nr:serine hydrolase [Oscillospiraceae bacterium]